MAAIDFPYLLLLITLFTVALTSSVKAGPDGTSSMSPDFDQGSSPKSFSSEVEHHTPAEKKESKVRITLCENARSRP
ncbi:hypothetical protein X777_05554 [Ooceraea biroi]|uniref:Uncharacterized protein n=1 Tax=Ooceraea biroi TaxID=2015173 RepID=A0A026WGW7_OOCBI|nr:hypothetical protein X777_05554 [Ooceraea biroi]